MHYKDLKSVVEFIRNNLIDRKIYYFAGDYKRKGEINTLDIITKEDLDDTLDTFRILFGHINIIHLQPEYVEIDILPNCINPINNKVLLKEKLKVNLWHVDDNEDFKLIKEKLNKNTD